MVHPHGLFRRSVVAIAFSLFTALALGNPPGDPPARVLQGHQKEVVNLAFSYDGKLLASSGMGEDRVLVWDVAAGKPLAEYAPHLEDRYPVHASFSPDASRVAIGGLVLKRAPMPTSVSGLFPKPCSRSESPLNAPA